MFCALKGLARVILGAALLSFAGGASAHPGQGINSSVFSIVKVKIGQDKGELQRLVNEGYDVAGVNLANGTVDVIAHNQEEGLSLKFLGFAVLSMKDVDTTLAPDSNYKTPQEIEGILHRFATDYPGIAHLESIGKSLENRDIWALKISDNPEQHELDEPAVVFNGMHHAREVMSPEVPLDIAEYLLTRYGQDPQVTRWVDNNEIWIMPMVNPDGSNKVWNGSSMWRKNTRGGYGVDINRNYPYAWNTCQGSSGSTFADDYRGPSAASEPETQAMMGFISRVQPVFDISFHSYSELVIFPYGCQGRRSETRDVVEPLAQQMAALIPSDAGSGKYTPGTAWELLYSVDGSDIDWMYHEQHVIPYVIELNSDSAGFQPPYSKRQPTVEKLRPAWTALLTRLEGSGIRGKVTDGAGRAQPTTMLTVQSLAKDGAPTINWQIKADGTYHVVLAPGMYRLSFDLGDHHQTRDVTIGATRTDIDVEL